MSREGSSGGPRYGRGRLVPLWVAVVAVLAGGIAASLVRAQEEPSGTQLVVAAATRSVDAGSVRIGVRIAGGGGEDAVSLTFEGMADFDDGRMRFGGEFPGVGPIEFMEIDGVVYARIPNTVRAYKGIHTPWVAYRVQGEDQGLAPLMGGGLVMDGTGALDHVRSDERIRSVTPVGEGELRGEMVRRFEIHFAEAGAATESNSQLREGTLALDERGHVREFGLAGGPPDAPAAQRVTLEFWDYGVDTSGLTAPADHQVTRVSGPGEASELMFGGPQPSDA